jgi:hypothetical protein
MRYFTFMRPAIGLAAVVVTVWTFHTDQAQERLESCAQPDLLRS